MMENNIIKNLFVSSRNKRILKQIDKYEAKRADVLRREHMAEVLSSWMERESLGESAALIRNEEEKLRQERLRFESSAEWSCRLFQGIFFRYSNL